MMTKASIFLGASWIGTIGIIATPIVLLAELPDTCFVIATVLAVFSGLAMLATRRADEYTEGLWNAGASVAFGTLLILFLGLPAAEGVFDGAVGAERKQDIPATTVCILAIGSFYIGLLVKRLLGDA